MSKIKDLGGRKVEQPSEQRNKAEGRAFQGAKPVKELVRAQRASQGGACPQTAEGRSLPPDRRRAEPAPRPPKGGACPQTAEGRSLSKGTGASAASGGGLGAVQRRGGAGGGARGGVNFRQ